MVDAVARDRRVAGSFGENETALQHGLDMKREAGRIDIFESVFSQRGRNIILKGQTMRANGRIGSPRDPGVGLVDFRRAYRPNM